MEKEDLELREKLIQEKLLFDGYNQKMRELHNENGLKLKKIIDEIGFESIDKFDEKVKDAVFLIIQHNIDNPPFMKFCLEKLKKTKNFSKIQIAQLSDRIALFEGKPQKYGTQFDYDKHGILNPSHYDNLLKVNNRRAKIGLNSLEEQIEVIRNRAKLENQKPPKDFDLKIKEYNHWRKEVGWI